MAESYAQLRAMSDEELIAAHDQNAVNTSKGLTWYVDELARRDSARRERAMNRMTAVILLLTITNVALVAYEVLH